MGVRNLMSYCLKNKTECVEFVDLVEISNERGGIEILVDFNNIMGTLLTSFTLYLERTSANKYLMIIGSENETFDNYFTQFITILQVAKIKLVWFIDGGMGATLQHLESKLSTWIERHHEKMPLLQQIMMACAGQRDMVSHEELVVPLLFSTQMRVTLKKLNCEIIQCTSGEADDCIAKALIDRPSAFAIFSNDSDFCIFDQCFFFPTVMFDLDNDLGMKESHFLLPQPPLRKLRVGLIVAARLIRHFQFENHSQIVDLSIVKGNDYTRSLMTREIYQSIGLFRFWNIGDVADWIRRWGIIEGCRNMHIALKRNKDLREAVDYSRQLYTLQLCHQSPVQLTDEYQRYIINKIKEQRFHPDVITIYNQFYWRRPILEDTSPGFPCAEIALTPLRQFIYRMILPFGRDKVTEYGRGSYEQLKTHAVRPYDHTDHKVPFLHHISMHNIHKNLNTFVYIISHQELPGHEQNFIQLYGRRNGFIFSILRYFLLLNYNRNLHLSREEFLTLVAAVMLHRNEERFQSFAICPVPRTVTIANWFLGYADFFLLIYTAVYFVIFVLRNLIKDVYRHAYVYLGELLFVIQEFPEPGDLFSGAVWTVFHCLADKQASMRACQCVNVRNLNACMEEVSKVLFEKRHQIKKLVSGCYVFDGYL